MLLRCALLLFLWTTTSNGNTNDDRLTTKRFHSVSYSYWPSLQNGAKMMRIHKRELEKVGQNEGGGVKIDPVPNPAKPSADSPPVVNNQSQPSLHQPETNDKSVKKDSAQPISHTDVHTNETVVSSNATVANVVKSPNETVPEVDLSSPGVVKRGAIVFGGFALLAVAYFIFYRKKNNKNEPSTSHNPTDANQFRYGVLQSEDRRDNMELSRVPLTMESDEDEDDDLEIFDLEQKKKSMSYVNLQMNDEEVVKGPQDSAGDNDRDNLLLDIEDPSTDPLINWSNSGNKSIL